eukprot:scaffold2624_cov17-Prasinocladus_malaysianus.AAC.1
MMLVQNSALPSPPAAAASLSREGPPGSVKGHGHTAGIRHSGRSIYCQPQPLSKIQGCTRIIPYCKQTVIGAKRATSTGTVRIRAERRLPTADGSLSCRYPSGCS